jgi:hypothetical protein
VDPSTSLCQWCAWLIGSGNVPNCVQTGHPGHVMIKMSRMEPRPASVLLLSLGGRFLSLYCWACAVCSDIARALLPKNRFQNGAHTSNGLERTLAPNKYTTSSAADDRLSLLRDHRQGPESWWCVIHCSSSRSSADRSSVRAFERITCAASSRESPAMSVSHTNGSMPSVAPIP